MWYWNVELAFAICYCILPYVTPICHIVLEFAIQCRNLPYIHGTGICYDYGTCNSYFGTGMRLMVLKFAL